MRVFSNIDLIITILLLGIMALLVYLRPHNLYFFLGGLFGILVVLIIETMRNKFW